MLPCFENHGPHSFHRAPSRKLTEQEIEKMKLQAAKLKRHLEKVEE